MLEYIEFNHSNQEITLTFDFITKNRHQSDDIMNVTYKLWLHEVIPITDIFLCVREHNYCIKITIAL